MTIGDTDRDSHCRVRIKHDHDEEAEVCVLHVDLTTVMTAIKRDVRWILWLGGGAATAFGGCLVLLIGLFIPYMSGLHQEVNQIQREIVDVKAGQRALVESDARSEIDRKDIRSKVEELRKQMR